MIAHGEDNVNRRAKTLKSVIETYVVIRWFTNSS